MKNRGGIDHGFGFASALALLVAVVNLSLLPSWSVDGTSPISSGRSFFAFTTSHSTPLSYTPVGSHQMRAKALPTENEEELGHPSCSASWALDQHSTPSSKPEWAILSFASDRATHPMRC
jgi:hypothetical protein